MTVSESPMGQAIIPVDNEMTSAKIAFGKALFFDKRLSLDETVSCAVCHKPGLAFTDGLALSDGIGDKKSTRNSPTLLNTVFMPHYMYDGEVETLEMQALVPIQDHNEMGMTVKELVRRLKNVPEYQEAAKRIFNREVDAYVITRALAAYQRNLISDNSPFDQYYYGKNNRAVSISVKRGWKLFSEKLYCTSCHPAPHFSTYKVENNGLTKEYLSDKGRFRSTGDTNDYGKFKVPSLRNIEITGPYMHDGSIATLSEVIDHYIKGGSKNFNQHPVIQPFELTRREKSDLINFLHALTDMSFMERL